MSTVAETCGCGRTLEDCPLCHEQICLSCEDWERFHSFRGWLAGAWRHYVGRWLIP